MSRLGESESERPTRPAWNPARSPQIDESERVTEPDDQTGLCMRLWRSVVLQALKDILYFRRPSQEQTIEPDELYTAQARIEASTWIMSDGADFRHVCAMSGLDPALVRARAIQAIDGAPPV